MCGDFDFDGVVLDVPTPCADNAADDAADGRNAYVLSNPPKLLHRTIAIRL